MFTVGQDLDYAAVVVQQLERSCSLLSRLPAGKAVMDTFEIYGL